MDQAQFSGAKLLPMQNGAKIGYTEKKSCGMTTKVLRDVRPEMW